MFILLMYRVKAGERHFVPCKSKTPGCLAKHNFHIITTNSHPSFSTCTMGSAGTKSPYWQMLYRRVITRPFKSPQVPRAGSTHSRGGIKRGERPQAALLPALLPIKTVLFVCLGQYQLPREGSKVNIKQEREKNSCWTWNCSSWHRATNYDRT